MILNEPPFKFIISWQVLKLKREEGCSIYNFSHSYFGHVISHKIKCGSWTLISIFFREADRHTEFAFWQRSRNAKPLRHCVLCACTTLFIQGMCSTNTTYYSERISPSPCLSLPLFNFFLLSSSSLLLLSLLLVPPISWALDLYSW